MIDVPATVKVNPSPNPSPHTKITPVIIRFLDFVRSTLFSTTLRTPIAGNHTVKLKLTPPIMADGIVLIIADTFGIKLMIIARQAAIRITNGSYT